MISVPTIGLAWVLWHVAAGILLTLGVMSLAFANRTTQTRGAANVLLLACTLFLASAAGLVWVITSALLGAAILGALL